MPFLVEKGPGDARGTASTTIADNPSVPPTLLSVRMIAVWVLVPSPSQPAEDDHFFLPLMMKRSPFLTAVMPIPAFGRGLSKFAVPPVPPGGSPAVQALR